MFSLSSVSSSQGSLQRGTSDYRQVRDSLAQVQIADKDSLDRLPGRPYSIIGSCLSLKDVTRLNTCARRYTLDALMQYRKDDLVEVLGRHKWDRQSLQPKWRAYLEANRKEVTGLRSNWECIKRLPDQKNGSLIDLQAMAECFPSLRKIDVRFLEKCSIKEPCLQVLTKLPLEFLNVFSHNMTAHAFASIQGMPIRHLDLSWWDLSKVNTNVLATLALEHVDLGYSECTDKELGYLKDKAIRYLNVASCSSITSVSMSFLAGFRLEHLDVSRTKVADAGLEYLVGMRIRHLNLSSCPVTDAGMVCLKDFPLEFLDVSGTQVTAKGLSSIANKPIRHLDLGNCTDACMEILATLPLERLRISGANVSDQGLAHISGKPIDNLELSNCSGITDVGMAVLKTFPLKVLFMYGTKVTDVGFECLRGKPIHNLYLRQCPGITGKSIPVLETLPLTRLFWKDATISYGDKSQFEEKLKIRGVDYFIS